MDVLVERMRAARPDALRVVTRPAKRDVMARAKALGADVVLGEPPDVGRSLLLGLEGLDDDDLALVGFPDTIWEPVDGFVRLLALLRTSGRDVALGLFRTAEAHRSDVVALAGDGRVTGVQVKPQRPAGNLIWGCCVAPAGALRGLRTTGEPGLLLDALAADGRVAGEWLSDRWIDVGTPPALAAARGEGGKEKR